MKRRGQPHFGRFPSELDLKTWDMAGLFHGPWYFLAFPLGAPSAAASWQSAYGPGNIFSFTRVVPNPGQTLL